MSIVLLLTPTLSFSNISLQELQWRNINWKISLRSTEYISEIVEVSITWSSLNFELITHLLELPIYEQAKVWLKAYFRDDDVDVKEVYTIAKQFKKFLSHPDSTELEENQAMKFLEMRKEATTPLALRKKLREYDVDRSNKMSLLEYLMMRYHKTVKHFVENDVDCDPQLIAARNAATAEVEKVQEQMHELQDKIADLMAVVNKGGVQKFSAQQEISNINTKQIPELKEKLKKLQKDEQKASKAVDDYGSDLERLLKQYNLPSAD